MNSKQFKLIIDKMHKLDLKDIEHDAYYFGKVVCVTAKFNGGKIRISNRKDGIKQNSLEITIQSNRNGALYAQSTVRYPLGVAIFSPSWYRWRSFCRKIEKEIRRIKAQAELDKQEEERILAEEERVRVQEMLVEVLPEILEDAILGEDDD